MLKVMREQN